MIKLTSRDLVFDFTLSLTTVCGECLNQKVCMLAPVLNLPVISCRLFEEPEEAQERPYRYPGTVEHQVNAAL